MKAPVVMLALITAISLVSMPISSYAQTEHKQIQPHVEHENQAKQELRQVLTQYQGFTASFEQVVTDVDGNMVHQAQGNLAFKSPGKFIWQIQQPDEESLISDGKTLWWYNPFLEQVSIFDAKDAVETTPFALLVSDQDSVWQQFNIAKTAQGYGITPTDLDSAQVIELVISFKDNLLSDIQITDRSRQKSVYSLARQGFSHLEDRSFAFEIPAGIEIDDQRNITPITDGNVQY